VLIVLTTGRASYRRVVESLRSNIAHWRPDMSRLDLLVNIDRQFLGLPREAFFMPPCPPLRDGGHVAFADETFVLNADWLDADEQRALCLISPTTGFGHKKNACAFYAFRQRYDIVLFWDDDELAVYESKTGDVARWDWTDVVSAHACGNADVTFGFWTGYVSPIPDSFFTALTVAAKSALTRALGPITDVVDDATFFDRTATYFALTTASSPPIEIEEIKGGKWISGGNLGLHRNGAMNGRLPAFYTPRDSRGDDSVFSTGLGRAKVFRVPSGIYHDAFDLTDGSDIKIGEAVRKVQSAGHIRRFANVVRGWLAYAPALTMLRGVDSSAELVNESAAILQECDLELMNYFGSTWQWSRPSTLLRSYLATVEVEIGSYRETQEIWRELCEQGLR
jgi:hypothetical protein